MRTLSSGLQPAGETAAGPATTPTITTDVATAPPPPTPPIEFTPEGHLQGIEGVLDQVMGAVTRAVAPMVQEQIYPMIQRDKELQREIGAAAGYAIARKLRAPVWIAAGALAVIAGVMVYNAQK